MQNLIIVGAGGFGREVLQWCQDAGFDHGEWRIKGFLDDNPSALDAATAGRHAILGSVDDYAIVPDDRFVCAIGMPRVKKACVERLLARGARFVSVIHPSAVVGRTVHLGQGCVICPQTILTANIQLGDFVMVNLCSSVGHDACIGRWTTLSPHCDVTGGVEVGEGVFMGTHAALIPGIRVGDWAVVGAGSTAFRDVPAGATVVGVPAQRLLTRD